MFLKDAKSLPDFERETLAGGRVAGVDEAGRGPWAGPVVAAAVVLDPADLPDGLNDSKKLSEARREALYEVIQARALGIGVSIVEVEEIDQVNILNATMAAMARAVAALPLAPDLVLIDGNRAPKIDLPTETLIKGDAKSLSIAAASIIAKVTRDRLMRQLHDSFPQYGWDRNKGYGTKTHQNALHCYGITPHHRRSFKPIHNML
ncbi:MAG: ribonuclease HII [Alphaproteobacteria bacterium]|nr:MAG: ribonuclease HII [Alphaproteobacteria bacterium]